MKICIVLSTRPEIIKFAKLIKIFKQNKIDFFLINTNQHYINIMSDVFFKYFEIPKPKYNIKAKSKTYGGFFSKTIKSIENILHNEKPNYLIVQGDTNTAFAGCFAASIFNRKYFNDEKKIKIIHIEAGLRSFDERMPEEINRKLIDQLSNILFAPTKFDFENLKKKFYLITLHRPETVDDPKKFHKLIIDFEKIGKKFKIKFLFPLHPRTKNIIKKLNLKELNYIKFTRPLEFLDFLTVMSNCKIIFTDSGGIQEESSLLGVPCITIRTTTERQLSIINKSNILTGYDYKRILKAVVYFNKNTVKPSNTFGDGKVSKRIFNILKKLT